MNATQSCAEPNFQEIWKELGITSKYLEANKVPAQTETRELVYVDTAPQGRDIFLVPAAADEWFKMKSAANRDGITLILSHGFRSIAFQSRLIQNRLKKGESLESILTRVAIPGFSEHHTGCAIDVGSVDCFPPTQELAKTKTYEWLVRHAGEFRFYLSYPERNPFGIIFEPWHWCYRAE
jgi:zinc D-Ala-D-Ala carboxypeptidase